VRDPKSRWVRRRRRRSRLAK